MKIATLFITLLIVISINFINASNKNKILKHLSASTSSSHPSNLTVSGCWPCSIFPPGSDCCIAGETCNNGKKCCDTTTTATTTSNTPNPVGCETSCTPQCGGAKCGNGGCPMLPDSTCGSCDASKFEECDQQTGTCVKAPICYDCFSGVCCVEGEMCPGNTKCCSTSKQKTVDCYHNCTPKCEGRVCGPSNCPNERNEQFCGTCGDNNVCSSEGHCVCPAVCDCGASLCKKCPPESAGCGTSKNSRECSCLGPKENKKTVPPKSLVYEITPTGRGCENNQLCGGFIPINHTTATPYLVYFEGDKGGNYIQSVYVIFEAPNNKPFPGENIFINFGKNSTTQDTCARPFPNWLPNLHYPPFQIEITNCQQIVYPYCYSTVDTRCLNQGNCQSLMSTTTIGNDRGFWIKNPGTKVFTMIVSLTDYYYQCGGGNYAGGFLQKEGLSVEYIDTQ